MNFRRCTAALIAAMLAPLAGMVPNAGAVGFEHTSVVSANPVDYTPHVQDGTVKAIAVVGNRVYVGGTFTGVVNANTSSRLARNYLFAFDRGTGRVISTFVPQVDRAVQSIVPAADGTSIIIGGDFRTVNGTAQRSLAMVRQDGTRVTSFTGQTDGTVSKLLVRGNRLFAAGRFARVNGTPRSNLVELDPANGSLRALNVPVTEGRTKDDGTVTSASVYEMDADAAGTRLVVIGNFRRVGGAVRQQIAMIDLTSNALAPWFTERYPNGLAGTPLAFQCYQVFDTQMRDIEFAPDGSYFVVVTTGGAPDNNTRSLCDTTAKWATASPAGLASAPIWTNCTGGDTLYSVAVTGEAVYVGGHQRWLDNCGGRDNATPNAFDQSPGISAIDADSGRAVRTWRPGRTRGVGAEELVANADGLYIGSDTEQLGGEFHGRLGLFPMPPTA